MDAEIAIVDRGRGPQLSTSRITVLDLIPYFQRTCTYDEILRCLPTLTREEIAFAKRYYCEHQEEMDEKDRHATAYRNEQIRLQRLRFPEPEGTLEERKVRFLVSHLEEGGGFNGSYLLTDSTVHDDHAEDVLTGAEGNDWFLFNKDGDGGVKDKVTDMSTFEAQFAHDIDWLNNGL
jgi:uncharacterized protein (DUF433 family)